MIGKRVRRGAGIRIARSAMDRGRRLARQPGRSRLGALKNDRGHRRAGAISGLDKERNGRSTGTGRQGGTTSVHHDGMMVSDRHGGTIAKSIGPLPDRDRDLHRPDLVHRDRDHLDPDRRERAGTTIGRGPPDSSLLDLNRADRSGRLIVAATHVGSVRRAGRREPGGRSRGHHEAAGQTGEQSVPRSVRFENGLRVVSPKVWETA